MRMHKDSANTSPSGSPVMVASGAKQKKVMAMPKEENNCKNICQRASLQGGEGLVDLSDERAIFVASDGWVGQTSSGLHYC